MLTNALKSLLRRPASAPALARAFTATETVTLGRTGIRTTLLAMGTGSHTKHGVSRQAALPGEGLDRILGNGYDRGLRFIDTADSYGTHAHVRRALRQMDRAEVTVLTKTMSRDPKEVRRELDRFRRELGIDAIDILLMHCVVEPDWTERYKPVMDVLSELKAQGVIGAHGCSCHSIAALRAAARSPWVEVDLVRLNPIGKRMDASPQVVSEVIREMRAAGKGVVGMKILAEGALRNRTDEALRYALGSGLLDSMTIGAESIAEQNDLIDRIGRIGAEALPREAAAQATLFPDPEPLPHG